MGFTVLELVVVISLLGILAAAVIGAFDPLERAKRDRDEKFREEAGVLVGAVNKFYAESSTFPWIGTSLPWTKAQDIEIEKLKKTGKLPNGFENQDKIFIGRGEGSNEPVWACFVPLSRGGRLDIVKLNDIRLGSPVPDSGEPEECLVEPDWQNTFCYVCISK